MIRSKRFQRFALILIIFFILIIAKPISGASSFDDYTFFDQSLGQILMPWYDVTDTEKFVCMLTGGPDYPSDDASTAAYRAYLNDATIAMQAERTLLYEYKNETNPYNLTMYQVSWYVEAPFSTEPPNEDGEIPEIVIDFKIYMSAKEGNLPRIYITGDEFNNYPTNFEGASGFNVVYYNHTNKYRYTDVTIEYEDEEGIDRTWSVPVVEAELEE